MIYQLLGLWRDHFFNKKHEHHLTNLFFRLCLPRGSLGVPSRGWGWGGIHFGTILGTLHISIHLYLMIYLFIHLFIFIDILIDIFIDIVYINRYINIIIYQFCTT